MSLGMLVRFQAYLCVAWWLSSCGPRGCAEDSEGQNEPECEWESFQVGHNEPRCGPPFSHLNDTSPNVDEAVRFGRSLQI